MQVLIWFSIIIFIYNSLRILAFGFPNLIFLHPPDNSYIVFLELEK